ncbi:hypothetical protein GL213_08320 [Halogeometricum borinquense]|uniref:Uncharacterized protein n=2 Tax=Halogeometricum borinquense TaxID=60847 RepID=E4NLN2_HALBP|nr:hypothetical protein [Halogeometricum borinquense]ADQ67235.1 hypothetical protein Hbor_16670 [Halogeometricum borinquense DSM 11551]ELY29569.1 hypothetical protein C499_05780 [Halogeometricum borinquense DSM 11551]QIB74531.1 hypothetical protein G3I44_09710 [Halogeometricum borinquense]QIQ76525.1 hypothetical protein GL213_08320 [Halogeometricum borinquense]RYJ13811.1 hypothetical protein ELS19_07435 [Halogeometricum borinquense]
MLNAMHRSVTFALYQLTLALGILLMPVALLMRRVGIRLPLGRAVEAAGDAYERADGKSQTN